MQNYTRSHGCQTGIIEVHYTRKIHVASHITTRCRRRPVSWRHGSTLPRIPQISSAYCSCPTHSTGHV